MLVEFRIRNFALVDDVTIAPAQGLNVLTGETGAGKSVIITALSLVLGARPAVSPVRTGCDSARVDAVFYCDNPSVSSVLANAGIEPGEDGIVVLSREFSAAGRSTARLNHNIAPLSTIKALAEHLIDLHGQYAHQTLLRQPDQSRFLDATGPAAHRKLLDVMAGQYAALRTLRRRLQEFRENTASLEKEAEILRFRIKEIQGLISQPEELDTLQQDIRNLEYGKDLAEAVHHAFERLSADGASARDALGAALRDLAPVRGVSPDLDGVCTQLEEADALLDTAARSLGALRGAFEHNPMRLEELQDRLYQIKDLMKKTDSGTIQDLFAYKERSSKRLDDISLDEDSITTLESQAADLEKQAVATARQITESRRGLAEKFSRQLKKELRDLAMPGAVFQALLVPFDDGLPVTCEKARTRHLRPGGAERVEFLISPNPGEPPKPLDQIASGGELSRIMLALKSLLRSADDVPVLVFDEIDAGIGGETAHAIARKFLRLAGGRQILSITHLPQIAAAADRHFAVTKQVRSGRTVIHAGEVDGAARISEMARMLGAAGMQESRDFAEKLIQQARPPA